MDYAQAKHPNPTADSGIDDAKSALRAEAKAMKADAFALLLSIPS